MVQYFSIEDKKSIAINHPEKATWVNVLPPLKEEEFYELSKDLLIPIDFLKDSLDIDERSRFETEENVKLIVIKTPTENNSFNESDAFYITIPICIIITRGQIVTVNSFENEAIKKFLNSFQHNPPEEKNGMALKIFEKIITNFQDYLKEINQRRNVLEQKLYVANRNEDLFQLMRIQKSLVYFITALRSNELLMMKIARTNFLQLGQDEKDFLDDLVIENSQALETANTYTNILSSTLDAYASIISNNQNLVLKRLATLTILLSIPVLIASIYGMNVPLPYQDSHFAFWIPTAVSLLILAYAIYNFVKQYKR
ncbi:MAG TPA: magnesium transporter CorA family protein [Ferruginibacter sp.]|jgi:magnesium transporter|nr:magnesium transporter CorA family protein [Bacteroidota bacterium]MCC6693335.1 magnesium transporter CorA family protein [Chitinophagaceae bacterium]HMT96050.1 magnesium transporter CorA family protein [Ferruginibacter sp.]HMU25455.1 magnesium transporter CorA family protein [Ferruginibacter sp.]